MFLILLQNLLIFVKSLLFIMLPFSTILKNVFMNIIFVERCDDIISWWIYCIQLLFSL